MRLDIGAHREQTARTMALIEQAFYQAQLIDLLLRIQAFSVAIAQRLRKAVTAFPDAQGVFANPGFPLDCGNRHFNGVVHI